MRTVIFSLAAYCVLLTSVRAQSFEQTAAFIALGGDVDLSKMTLNADGSVSTPPSAVGLAVTPPQTWTSIASEEGCVAQGFGPSLQTGEQVAVQIHFNHVVGWTSGQADAQRSVAWLVGEEPVFCVQPVPNHNSAPTTLINTNCAEKLDVAMKNLNRERVGNALVHLFSKYCHQAVRKNAF